MSFLFDKQKDGLWSSECFVAEITDDVYKFPSMIVIKEIGKCFLFSKQKKGLLHEKVRFSMKST